ncbi:RagB/SusD family nutrient uptake outer membrane protein [Longitalea luteola]|uniref:RagB/SusD family nutrient uptake outer membrane protein n=1 Tax=Longitalea luteola TaxID=2812563 RepID=UPI001A970278|nr:RagB/SusD family nutrient uptake outer membrane protein [Longitalea luteola]
MKVKIHYLRLLLVCLWLTGCNKKEFLEEKPDSDLFVPTSLEDCQALLDNEARLSITPALGELSADNFFLVSSFWELLPTKERNAYIWAPDIYQGEGRVSDWNAPYEQVLYANVVLDALKKISVTPDNIQQWNNLKGAALFIRAYAFYNLAQVFALPYNQESASLDKGIPLKLTPNVDESLKRSSVEETYAQIQKDLLEAQTLLLSEITKNRNRPNKPAALAQLARVYVSMRQYDKAGIYADSSLRLYSKLIDYNSRDAVSLRFFERPNDETMYQSRFIETNVLKSSPLTRDCIVDSILYGSYSANDLRRSMFFSNNAGRINFKGHYSGSIVPFTGLATDEMYLVRAECRARAGNVTAAMEDLNALLQKRWKTGTFVPYSASSPGEALDIILLERRKEMPCRGVRWTDIRRLNLDFAGITPKRVINGQEYILPVSSRLYALPIPADAQEMGNYEPNER